MNIKLKKISPYHPEPPKKEDMKNLLKKTGEQGSNMVHAFLEYRNTPRLSDSLNPAQWVFRHFQQTGPSIKIILRVLGKQKN